MITSAKLSHFPRLIKTNCVILLLLSGKSNFWARIFSHSEEVSIQGQSKLIYVISMCIIWANFSRLIRINYVGQSIVYFACGKIVINFLHIWSVSTKKNYLNYVFDLPMERKINFVPQIWIYYSLTGHYKVVWFLSKFQIHTSPPVLMKLIYVYDT